MKKFILWTKTVLIMLLVVSCQQDDLLEKNDVETSNFSQARVVATEGAIPFEVENVRQALEVVLEYYQAEKPEIATRFSNYNVNVTHIYYKFIPQDSIQYSTLMADEKNLDLTTDRFEYTPVERTEDPADEEIPVFYSIVEAGYRIPAVPYEIIAELHFTNEDELEDIPANYDEVEFKQNLMYEARKRVGDLDEEELAEGYMDLRQGFEEDVPPPPGLFGKKWRPSGTILVEDDWLSEKKGSQVKLPVYRVEVNVLKWGWLRVENGSTNHNGYFSTGTTYTKKVHYNVKFTDFYKVIVRPGNFFAIANWKSGSHKRQSLNVTFVKNTKHQFYALINNAAWDYFNRVVPTYGIYNPTTIEISGHYNSDKSNYWFGWVPFRSEVKIGGKHSDGTRKRSDAIYATVIHEITHKSHYKMDGQAFNSIAGSGAKHKLFLRESWAVCVETVATNDKYKQYFNQHSLGNYVASISYSWQINRLWKTYKQYETVGEMDEYSPAFIDLMDYNNQKTFSSSYPEDRVSGYTLSQIQTALNGSHTILAFGNKLKLLYNNPTEQFVDDIINYSETVIDGL